MRARCPRSNRCGQDELRRFGVRNPIDLIRLRPIRHFPTIDQAFDELFYFSDGVWKQGSSIFTSSKVPDYHRPYIRIRSRFLKDRNMTPTARCRRKNNWIGTCLLSLASGLLLPLTGAIGDDGGLTKDQGELQIDPNTLPRRCVGQIFIVGNEEIPDSIILEQCPLFPGGPASIADRRETEENLASLGLFVVDRKRGIKPKVTFLDREGDSVFYDVQIEVKEKPNAKQILAFREGIRFVADWRTWGLCAAVYRAEDFPLEILSLPTEGKMGEVADLIRAKFRDKRTGYSPPAAVLP
jgi:hypothetical protein